jgi:hypothetical protein
MLDHRSIVLYLHKKRLSPKCIYDDLVLTLGLDATAYGTVASDVHDVKYIHPKFTSPPDMISGQLHEFDQAILLIFEEQPFSSVKQLSCSTHLSRMTVYRRLTRSLNFRVRHLRHVPHLQSDTQTAERVEGSQFLLSMLQGQQDRAWYDIVTLDESKF